MVWTNDDIVFIMKKAYCLHCDKHFDCEHRKQKSECMLVALDVEKLAVEHKLMKFENSAKAVLMSLESYQTFDDLRHIDVKGFNAIRVKFDSKHYRNKKGKLLIVQPLHEC